MQLTPKQAAGIIGCCVQHVRLLCQQGRLRCRKVKTESAPYYRYSIREEDARRFADEPQTVGYPRGRSRS